MIRRTAWFVASLGGIALVAGLAACAASPRIDVGQSPSPGRPATVPPYRYRVPAALDDGWATASLDDVGLDRRPIEAMTDAIRRYTDWNIHAVLLERDGRLVYEEYFAGNDQRWGQPLGPVVFDRHVKHDLRSVSKSVVSALVGIALGTGTIRSIDQPLLDFFPELTELATTERRRLTVRHALTMSAGLDWNETVPYTDPRNDEIVMTRSPAPIRYILDRPIVAEPGAIWNYNGGLTQLLGTIVQRASGQPLRDYAEAVLFRPLGTEDVEWMGSIAGVPSAASGLRLRARDLAKFGSLYLHGGRWRGRQVVPPEWVRESTRRHLALRSPLSSSAYGGHGYGYQWWHNCYWTARGAFEAFTAAGNGHQRVHVLPELDLVLTVLAGRYNDPSAARLSERLLLEQIVPAALGASTGAPAPGTAACAPA